MTEGRSVLARIGRSAARALELAGSRSFGRSSSTVGILFSEVDRGNAKCMLKARLNLSDAERASEVVRFGSDDVVRSRWAIATGCRWDGGGAGGCARL